MNATPPPRSTRQPAACRPAKRSPLVSRRELWSLVLLSFVALIAGCPSVNDADEAAAPPAWLSGPTTTLVLNAEAASHEDMERTVSILRDLAFTTKNVNRREANIFDGKIIMAPRINDPINGKMVVSGINEAELTHLVTVLKSGRLPIELSLEVE